MRWTRAGKEGRCIESFRIEWERTTPPDRTARLFIWSERKGFPLLDGRLQSVMIGGPARPQNPVAREAKEPEVCVAS